MPGRRTRTLPSVGFIPASFWAIVPEIQRSRLLGPLFFCRLLGGIVVLTIILLRALSGGQLYSSVPDMVPAPKQNVPPRLVLMTLEYKKSTFSGNGVYAQSIARSLANKGNIVLVISGRPTKLTTDTYNTTEGFQESLQKRDSNLYEIDIGVDEKQWGRLDWKCPWQSFADGITENVLRVIVDFQPSWILLVDWSSLPAFQRLRELGGNKQWRMAYLNFRLYFISKYNSDEGSSENEFYKTLETQAVSMASAIAALSSRDAQILLTELGSGISSDVRPKPLFPPLREDIRQVALSITKNSEEWNKSRKYISCCVRLSPEKNAELFAAIVETLSNFLMTRGIIPFLCGGAHGSGEYANTIKQRVKDAVPSAVIYEGFMGPAQLADTYSQTLLNIHPCIYDAYGMTIVEAAAFEAPSVVHIGPGGAVGAAEFLEAGKGQIFALDLTSPMDIVAANIRQLLKDEEKLSRIGKAASMRSLSWNEDANAQQLIEILQSSSH
eukprot:TRINITY_DN23592_c0_g2_i1.p1 TRINITY_DN23592_c0_g2~~TRINITY_DN23592_c0_g2_i1.p1  ORF type:complete len:496 (-),score=74.18 TRINITY_DN23592_c0_g2_i1:489-1976(-)